MGKFTLRAALATLMALTLLPATVPTAAGGRPARPRTKEAAIRFRTALITPEGRDRYVYRAGPGTFTVAAPATNQGGNLRAVWWPSGARPVQDQQSCVTWTRIGGPIVQAGLSLRVADDGGKVRALTVTNNIWSGARAGWNVHAWRTDTAEHEIIGQVRLSQVFGATPFEEPELPWRVCARVVGRALELKAWPLRRRTTEPAWGDPRYGTSVQLGADWVYPSVAGWYVGHAQAGEHTSFAQLDAGPARVDAGDLLGLRVRASASALYEALVGPVVGGRGRWGAPLPARVTPDA